MAEEMRVVFFADLKFSLGQKVEEMENKCDKVKHVLVSKFF